MPKKTTPRTRAATMDQRRMEPERFVEDLRRGLRENHTQKKFVPAAMYFSLGMGSRRKAPAPRPKAKAGGRARARSPSTRLLDQSNVKRKPAARGRG